MALKQIVSTNFDWVTARAGCSPVEAFERLRLQIEKDIKTRQSLARKDRKFSMEGADVESFSVLVEGSDVRTVVRFSLSDRGNIVVRDATGSTMFEAVLTLSDDGECRLKINGKEYDFWQVLRKALEGIFFEM